MAQQTPDPIKSQAESSAEPIIPPSYLLALAAAAFAVAIFVTISQPEPGVVGIGGFAFGLLALVLWVIMSPDQARGALTGRTLRFGGTSVLVTVLVLAVLVGVYAVVRNLQLRVDLTESSEFSLTEESRAAITALGADPSIPEVHMLIFYSNTQAGVRDRNKPLFDDYVATSNGKIVYEFIDPDVNPQIATSYGVTSNGQIAVTTFNEAGELDTENAEVVTVNQQDLTNAILKAAAQGDFRAYFLTVREGVGESMSLFRQTLTDVLDWDVQDVSLFQFTSEESELTLNDANLDGEVMIIPGGIEPLTDEDIQVLRDYTAAGGDLIVFASSVRNDDLQSLATADNFSTFLTETFGMSVNNDIVIDLSQAYNTPYSPVGIDFDETSFITTSNVPTDQAAAVFPITASISIAETPPANVTVTPLVRTSDTSYAKTDLAPLQTDENAYQRAEGDTAGPFVVMASAENTQTGARLVLVGSSNFATDQLAINGNFDNFSLTINSPLWTSDYVNFAEQVTVIQPARPQDLPISATEGTLSFLQTISCFVLPFGVLLIGLYVWWSSRERARA